MQSVLDTALAQASTAAQRRFDVTNHDDSYRRSISSSASQYESWESDLERVLEYLARQEFHYAETLLNRWLNSYQPNSADASGMLLYGRSLAMLGDMQGQLGVMDGPGSARSCYQRASRVFTEIGADMRSAQVELQEVVLTEMAGQLDTAARKYRALADNHLLRPRDQVRAKLWIGTALSKSGNNIQASAIIKEAIDQFDALGEAEDWSIAHEKLALAHRGRGALDAAHAAIETAVTSTRSATPMHIVRTSTARGHIIATDPACRDHGLNLLYEAACLAARHRLGHQLVSIEAIQAALTT